VRSEALALVTFLEGVELSKAESCAARFGELFLNGGDVLFWFAARSKVQDGIAEYDIKHSLR
jgi:hypothetical protein